MSSAGIAIKTLSLGSFCSKQWKPISNWPLIRTSRKRKQRGWINSICIHRKLNAPHRHAMTMVHSTYSFAAIFQIIWKHFRVRASPAYAKMRSTTKTCKRNAEIRIEPSARIWNETICNSTEALGHGTISFAHLFTLSVCEINAIGMCLGKWRCKLRRMERRWTAKRCAAKPNAENWWNYSNSSATSKCACILHSQRDREMYLTSVCFFVFPHFSKGSWGSGEALFLIPDNMNGMHFWVWITKQLRKTIT